MPLVVSELFIYPLKSAAPVAVAAAAVGPRGLAGDRRWMVTDPDGRFLTARKHPRLTRIQAHLVEGGLRLSADGLDIEVPQRPPHDASSLRTTIWGDEVPAQLAPAAASERLSVWLGVDCRLVFMADSTRRPVDPVHAPAGDVVSFADGFPLLLTTDGSLTDLNRRLGRPVGMGRFRPNLVVSGAGAFEEDGWAELAVGGAVFGVVKPCARCVMTTVDPALGAPAPDGEPLKTLAGYRKAPGGVMFGQNLTVRQPGPIAVGDRVVVTARR